MDSELVLGLLEQSLKSNKAEVISLARNLAARELANGHRKVSNKILTLIQNPATNQIPKAGFDGPLAKNEFIAFPKPKLLQNEEGGFIPEQTLQDIQLPDDLAEQLTLIARELENPDLLKPWGIQKSPRIMLSGVSGTGKTLAGLALAGQAKRTLHVVHLEKMLSSYLGETARNLGQIFQEAANSEGIVFLDEIDALTRTRNVQTELGEMRRTVNAIIMILDRYQESVSVIGATNHPEDVDSAVMRRFPDHLRFPIPNERAREKILRVSLQSAAIEVNRISFRAMAKITDGLTGAELESIAHRAIRAAALGPEQKITPNIFMTAYLREINADLTIQIAFDADESLAIAYMVHAEYKTKKEAAEEMGIPATTFGTKVAKFEELLDQASVNHGQAKSTHPSSI